MTPQEDLETPVKVHIKYECGHEIDILSPSIQDPVGLYRDHTTPAPGSDVREVYDIFPCELCGESKSSGA